MKAILITACECKRTIEIREFIPEIQVPLCEAIKVMCDWSGGPDFIEIRNRTFRYYGMLDNGTAEYREKLEKRLNPIQAANNAFYNKLFNDATRLDHQNDKTFRS